MAEEKDAVREYDSKHGSYKVQKPAVSKGPTPHQEKPFTLGGK